MEQISQASGPEDAQDKGSVGLYHNTITDSLVIASEASQNDLGATIPVDPWSYPSGEINGRL